ncbi:MAG: BrnT family toxin [Elusimicrobiota bacterium]
MDRYFQWHDDKNRSNWLKHGVDFDEALSVFDDENGILIADPDPTDDEDRFVFIGRSAKIRILVVCHCYRESDTVIRIISARKATRTERFAYEELLP